MQKGLPVTPIMTRLNPFPDIDTYFFMILYNIFLPRDLVPLNLPD
jgi:hypothetical protein